MTNFVFRPKYLKHNAKFCISRPKNLKHYTRFSISCPKIFKRNRISSFLQRTQYQLSFFLQKFSSTAKFRIPTPNNFKHNSEFRVSSKHFQTQSKFRISRLNVSNTIPNFVFCPRFSEHNAKFRVSRPRSFKHNTK